MVALVVLAGGLWMRSSPYQIRRVLDQVGLLTQMDPDTQAERRAARRFLGIAALTVDPGVLRKPIDAIEDPRKKALLLSDLADALRQAGKGADAATAAEGALTVAKAITETKPVDRVTALSSAAVALEHCGRRPEALDAAKAAVEAALEFQDPSGQPEALALASEAMAELGAAKEAYDRVRAYKNPLQNQAFSALARGFAGR